jgi:tetratricopeptide (TPR) repeat protein
LAVALLVCLPAISPSADGDIWWHLAAGRWMVQERRILDFDPFSTSSAGNPWIDVHWVFQLLVYGCFQAAGLLGLVGLKVLGTAAGGHILAAGLPTRARNSSWYLLGFGVVLGSLLFSCRSLLLVRPVILTLVFLAIYWASLERARTRPHTRALWVLPLIQVAWVNIQGLFALGLAMVVLYTGCVWLTGRRQAGRWFLSAKEVDSAHYRDFLRSLLRTTGLCFVACFASPFVTDVWRLSSRLLLRLAPLDGNVYATNIAENIPPFALEAVSGEFWHFKWVLAALALILVALAPRFRLTDLGLLGGFGALALVANRNVLLFYWMAAPIVFRVLALHAQAGFRLRFGRRVTARLVGLVPAVLVFCTGTSFAGHALVLSRETDLRLPAPFRAPEASVNWLELHTRGGRVFTADHYGGYLIWRLYPEHRPFIDTRLVLRTAAQYEEFLRVVDEPENFAAFAERERFDFAVLPTSYPDRYLSLIGALYQDPSWALVFSNGSEVVFSRTSLAVGERLDLGTPETTAQILEAARRAYDAPRLKEAATLHLVSLLLAAGEWAEAEHLLLRENAVEARTGQYSQDLEALYARLRLVQGDLATAKRIAERLVMLSPDDYQMLNILTKAALIEGDLKRAKVLLERSLEIAPYDSEARRLLSELEKLSHAN